jgi:hypothetical protein
MPAQSLGFWHTDGTSAVSRVARCWSASWRSLWPGSRPRLTRNVDFGSWRVEDQLRSKGAQIGSSRGGADEADATLLVLLAISLIGGLDVEGGRDVSCLSPSVILHVGVVRHVPAPRRRVGGPTQPAGRA